MKRVVLYFLLIALCAYGGTLVATIIFPRDGQPLYRWLLKCLIVLTLISAVTSRFVHKEGQRWRDYGILWNRTTVWQIAGLGILGGLLVLAWSGAVAVWAPFHWQLNSHFSPADFAISAVAACAMGVAEEVGYRSYGLTALHRAVGPVPAVIITSLIFTLAHVGGGMDWRAGLLVVGTCSMLYGSIMLATQSLPAVAAFHTANNLFQDWLLRPSAGSPWEPIPHQSGEPGNKAFLPIWASMAAINLCVTIVVSKRHPARL